jgi:hypothetical protein
VSAYGERVKAAVAELIERGEEGSALEEAKKIDDLAKYLGEGQERDLYAELDGDKVVDESFLRMVAAEESENRGWDLSTMLNVIAILADVGLVLFGGSNSAMIEASVHAGTKLIEELT